MDNQHSFHFADYVLFSVAIAISIGIGIYYAFSGGKQRTTSEFLVGNRQMSVLPVAISLIVSFESSVMILGVPAEIYMFGFQWIWGEVGLSLAELFSLKIVVPLIHPLRITSVYEYLELRFKSHSVRMLGTILGSLSNVVFMGIVLFGPGIALEAVTGFPLWSSIVVVCVAAVIYTSVGGIKAVIWTDVFQSIIMFAGIFAILIKGTISIGGVGKTWEIAKENGRINIFNFDPDPRVRHTFWNLLFGNLLRGMGFIFHQSSVQRIISIPTVQQAKNVIWITTPAFFLTMSLAAVEGIIAYSYYHTLGCDPLASKQIRDPNQVVPYMVMDIFSGVPGMPGLFLASLFCASLTTLSSLLSSLSALLLTDIIIPHTKPMSDRKATVIAKVSVIGFGIVAIAIALLISFIGGTLTQIATTILSAFSAPLVGLFLLGCFVPYANAKGAITGTTLSVIYCFWLAFGKSSSEVAKRTPPLPPAPTDMCLPINNTYNMNWFLGNSTDMIKGYTEFTTTVPMKQTDPEGLDQMYSLSYLWIGPIGIILVLIIGSVVSLCTGSTKLEDRDPRYLIPLFDEMLWWLPESCRKRLRCGVVYPGRQESHTENRADNTYNLTMVIGGKDSNDKNCDSNKSETVVLEENNDMDDSNSRGRINETSGATEINPDIEEPCEDSDSNEEKSKLLNSGTDMSVPTVDLNDSALTDLKNGRP